MTQQQTAEARQLLAREQGTVRKDWGGRLPIALAFPNTYHLGMSSLAIHSLYRLWNSRDEVVCERVFTPQKTTPKGADWLDSPQTGFPTPRSVETGAPLDYFPVIALSISYEMDYFNVVALLRGAGIPPRAIDRDDSHPLIIAGGAAMTANPEPLAPCLDAVVVGEVEPIIDPLTNALQLVPDGRDVALNAMAQVPGIYLPDLHHPASDSQPIIRQWLEDLDAFPTHSVLFTPDTEFGEMALIEIARGCGRGCRFCLAGFAYRPPRQRSAESILAQARDLLRFSSRLGLVSAAVSDHAQIDRLATELRGLGARISVSSMRVDPISEPLIAALAQSGTQTLTLAPEAGSERLRRVINKTQTEDDVLHAVELAARYHLRQIKLYFMVGLPTEEEDDVQALVDLALGCAERFPGRVTVNLTPFVPKAHTPFQRMAQTPAKVVKRRSFYVERRLRRQGIAVKSESPAWAEIQGTLARGDHSVAEAILSVGRLRPSSWQQALDDAGLSMSALLRQRDADERLPWDLLQGGVRQSYLAREARRADAAHITLPCPVKDCSVCGICAQETC